MVPGLSPERLSEYRAVLARREADARVLALARRERAWLAARKAAELLHDRFGARRVLLFGSLVDGEWFGDYSDVDLAAQGVPLGEFFRAVAMLQDVDPEFSMDLVDLDDCSASLLARVEAEGLPL
jgi:predicted nucleotidyltransferase